MTCVPWWALEDNTSIPYGGFLLALLVWTAWQAEWAKCTEDVSGRGNLPPLCQHESPIRSLQQHAWNWAMTINAHLFFFHSHISPSFPLFCYDSSGRSEGPCIEAAEYDCDEGFLGCPGRAQWAFTSVPRGTDRCVFVWCSGSGYKGETLHREWLLQISQLYFACQHWLHRYGVSSMLHVPKNIRLIAKCRSVPITFT